VGGAYSFVGPAALALLGLATALDVLAAGQPGVIASLAFWTVMAGVAAGTWYTVFALLDWVVFAQLGESGVCGLDGFVCAIVVGLFGLSALLRVDVPAHAAPPAAAALEVAGAALIGMKAWIGRELAAWICERR
jgi:hypothetical protein